ncbi:uncharacterized protein PV07_08779 [Cladophialophora immunda]|uniref:Uncharacterized protein n=1 Tax=Cladophialophora immunda TaxID=569365 RepID=A0A0D2C333_9EURO|nr:uncharacterized protein PV07_08779 [Cladophialophora immunda]KIW25613.1 hypothetical protein PV07_08779 [Cladophialophora immunda]OQV11113.1 hypothetical protein CLAIMM_15008 [Cladophialophora immunda]
MLAVFSVPQPPHRECSLFIVHFAPKHHPTMTFAPKEAKTHARRRRTRTARPGESHLTRDRAVSTTLATGSRLGLGTKTLSGEDSADIAAFSTPALEIGGTGIAGTTGREITLHPFISDIQESPGGDVLKAMVVQIRYL